MAKNKNDYSHILDSKIAGNLKSTRERQGLTQDEFAARLSISKRTLQRYELGNCNIPQSVRFQVILEFESDIAPSIELFEEIEFLKATYGMPKSRLDRIGGSEWRRFRARVLAFRLSNFTPWGQRVLARKDYLSLFLIGCIFGGQIWVWRTSDANEILPSNLILFSVVLLLFASTILELPLARTASRILAKRNPKD